MTSLREFAEYVGQPYAPVGARPLAGLIAQGFPGSTISLDQLVRTYAGNANVIARHDYTSQDYQKQWDEYPGLGFRPICISVYGDRNDPLYASVWIRRPGPAYAGIHGTDAAGLQALFDEWAGKGYSPSILAAAGPADNPVYAAVMEQSTHGVSLTRPSLIFGTGDRPEDDPATIQHWLQQARNNNWIPRWISIFGEPGNRRYTLVLDPNPQLVRWNVAGLEGEDAGAYQNRFEAQMSQWAWPALVTLTPDGQYLGVFRDGDLAPWKARHGQTSGDYQKEIEQDWPEAFFPLYVQAGDNGANTRFASLFTRRETPSARHFTASGPEEPVFSTAEAKIEQFMRDSGTRAMGLAITRDGRLVHARGFTWAEAGYPTTQPTTTFRLASLSKALSSIGAHWLVQHDHLVLTEHVLGILGWHPPPQGDPFTPGVETITVRHLLTHAAGWNRDLISDFPRVEDVADAFGRQQFPVLSEEMARTKLTQALQFTPGTDQSYVNMGYLILGHVIARRAGISYLQFMQNVVFGPLGLTRPHRARAAVNDQLPGSARQHERTLDVRPTVLSGDIFGARPLVPLAYGGEDFRIFDAFGGWAMAAVDYAKVLASLAEGDDSPVLSQASLDSMWMPSGFKAGSTYLDGWDSFDAGGGKRALHHGGAMPGVRTGMLYHEDGWGYALFGNSDDNVPGLYLELLGINAANWPTHDLFPQYGIPSF
jgi:CubicO group peptidase (beta-lactamase class C family)